MVNSISIKSLFACAEATLPKRGNMSYRAHKIYLKLSKVYLRKWSIQAMSFRANPFHANYILNVYNMSYI